MKSYRDLYVWSASVDLAVDVIRLSAEFHWRYRALADQMQRSALSVPSNIAEGKGRMSRRELSQFLSIARGSLCELTTQLEIADRLGLMNHKNVTGFRERAAQIGAGINSMLRYFKSRSIQMPSSSGPST